MTKETAPRHLMKGLTYSPMQSALAVLLQLTKRTRPEIYLENRYIIYPTPRCYVYKFAFSCRAFFLNSFPQLVCFSLFSVSVSGLTPPPPTTTTHRHCPPYSPSLVLPGSVETQRQSPGVFPLSWQCPLLSTSIHFHRPVFQPPPCAFIYHIKVLSHQGL